METKFWAGNSRVIKLALGLEPTKEAFIVYHGFPGEPPPAEAHLEKYRNLPRKCIDVARALSSVTRCDVFLPHYEGLGESVGKFTFGGSVRGSIGFAEELCRQSYEKIHLVGNSWGGLVAYNAYRRLDDKRGRLILISPLLDLPSDDWVRSLLPYYVRSYPNVLGAFPEAFDRAVLDLCEVRRRYNPADIARHDRPLGRQALIVHGTKDEAVPVEASRRFTEAFGCRLVELEADHAYSADRAPMIEAVLAFAQDR